MSRQVAPEGLIPDSIKSWLLESSEPSLRYRTFTELLGMPAGNPEAAQAHRAIPGSVAVRQILGCMEPGGYWVQTNPRTRATVGEGTEYGSFATTHFCLSYLAHLGMDASDDRVAFAANRYLDLMQPDGD